jgi:hypothetical protein
VIHSTVLRLSLLVALGIFAIAGAEGVGAQDSPAAPADAVGLRLRSVSPVVPPVGSFELRFEPTDAVPPGSVLEIRFHRLISGRADLRDRVNRISAGAAPGDTIRRPVRIPDGLLGNPLAGWAVTLPVTDTDEGDPQAIVLPTDGIIPVSLDLVGPDGSDLWNRTVFLVRPPSERPIGRDGRPAELAVTVALALDSPPTLAPDGRADIPEDIIPNIDGVSGLLEAVPDFPFTLAIEPNLLSGLDRSETPSAVALASALQQPGLRGVSVRRTDVPVDTGGIIAANGLDVLEDLLVVGSDVLESGTLQIPVDHTWVLDDSLSPESLPALDGLGVRRIVLPADRIIRPGDVDDPEALWRTMVLANAQPDVTEEPPFTPLTVIAEDPLLALQSLDTAADPGVAANRVSTELAAQWFSVVDLDPTAFPGPQAFMFVPPMIDPAILLALAPALDGSGVLRSDPRAAPPPAVPIDGEYAVANVPGTEPPDQSPAVAAFRSSLTTIDGVRSVVGISEPIVDTWTLLNTQSMSESMDAATRSATHSAIASQSRVILDRIIAPEDSSLVLGSQQSAIPLRFDNTLPYPVDVELRIRSNRIEFDDGDRQLLRLEPGDNVIELPVTVRASGESTIRFDVTSPDGSVGIASFERQVQATRFSGVGAALSIISLVVLAGWWISTIRKRRRRARRTEGRHPSESVTSTDSRSEDSVDARG